MKSIILLTGVLILMMNACSAKGDEAELNRRFATTVQPFLRANCFHCHGTDRQEAKLNLSGYLSMEQVAKAHQIWEIVLERLHANEMPPKSAKPQPTLAQRKAVIDWIHAVREFEATRNAGDPGLVPARRLRNAEYNYTIRDLTGVDIRPTRTFPIDPANAAGFDNSGESLTMSPALLKKYLDAARSVVDHLVLKPDGFAFAPHPVVTATDRDKYCVKRIVRFYERQPIDSADYFFAAWQHRHRPDGVRLTLEEVAAANGISSKYLKTVWLLLTDAVDNVGPIAQLRAMWRKLPSDPSDVAVARMGCIRMRDFVQTLRCKLIPKVNDLTMESSHKGSQPFVLWKNEQYAAHRQRYDASVLKVDDGTAKNAADPLLMLPVDPAAKALHLAAFDRFCTVFPDEFFVSERGRDYVGKPRDQQEKGRLLSAGFHSMMGYFRDDGPLYNLVLDEAGRRELDSLWQELDFVALAPMRQYSGFLWFERTDSRYMRDPEFDFARAEDKSAASKAMIDRLSKVYLEKARKHGGSKTAIKAIEDFFRNMDKQIRWVEAARVKAESSHLQALVAFAGKAFRRPLANDERDDLLAYYRALRSEDGLTHEEAIQDAIVAVLMSPRFSYRLELGGDGNSRIALSDVQLASRLSYFLWSSMPDEELLKHANAGTLHQPEVLVRQTRRLLQDARIRALAIEFGGNWLDFRRFEQHNAVDRKRFPAFTDELRQAMFEEPVRFFVDVAQHDRSVLSFMDADHTFVNRTLAKHYGVTNVQPAADEWIRVDNAGQYGRGGVLPMSVFLTKNAPGLRTSPVKRGYWVVRRLLGERIPPPPPNVSDFPEDETKLGDLTLREVLARNRDYASCSGCHQRFDSIGLIFESFGPIGERRNRDLGGRPVETTATLRGGQSSNRVSGFAWVFAEASAG
ncbi:MAG: DUF1592 domain-containing protein [Planctomycetota bacterium]|nr:DUF1592 domain-containing protein [Planctomycetota bacterium]